MCILLCMYNWASICETMRIYTVHVSLHYTTAAMDLIEICHVVLALQFMSIQAM